jgi:SAM-dependent methyltransferase
MSDPWYVAGFGDHYLELYAHRDQGEARAALELLEDNGISLQGKRVLDLCCGGGRHLELLAGRDARAVGLDLSPRLLAAARQVNKPEAEFQLLRGDMRYLPLRTGSLEGVLSMFTSFGYFQEDRENRQVLGEVARVLEPGGFFLFDYLNSQRVAVSLVPESTREGERWRALERRWIEGGRVHKSVRILHRETEELISEYEESVRLYPPEMIRGMLSDLNLTEQACWGSYRGEPFVSGSSRLLLLLRRSN